MFRLIFILIIFALTSCSTAHEPSNPGTATAIPSPLSTPTPLPQNTPATTPSYTPTPEPPPTSTPLPPPSTGTQYTFRAALNYSTKRLAVLQTIRFRNLTGENLDELLLVVEANWETGVFQLNAVTWMDGATVENWTLQNNLLRIPLKETLLPNASLTLTVDYGIALPSQAGVLGFDLRQINLGNWYPFLAPYQSGVGWLAYQKGWVGEHYSYDFADFELELTLTGSEQPLIVAASAPGEQDGDTHHFYLPSARSFALSISPEYQVFRKMIGEVEVLSYAYPETLAAGEQALNATAEALMLYNDLFGPYPHKSMTVVQVNFPDGLEFDGLYFLSEQYYWGYATTVTDNIRVQNYLTIIAVHETAHQWWYGLIGNDQAIEPWLDETFATYTELLFYEYYYPELVPWWWAFRVDYYSPRDCCVNFTIYQYGDPRAYINGVYLRGAYFMQELRGTMGDDAFFAALETYAERHRNGFATAQDFWKVIGEYTSEDLSLIRQRYFGGG